MLIFVAVIFIMKHLKQDRQKMSKTIIQKQATKMSDRVQRVSGLSPVRLRPFKGKYDYVQSSYGIS